MNTDKIIEKQQEQASCYTTFETRISSVTEEQEQHQQDLEILESQAHARATKAFLKKFGRQR